MCVRTYIYIQAHDKFEKEGLGELGVGMSGMFNVPSDVCSAVERRIGRESGGMMGISYGVLWNDGSGSGSVWLVTAASTVN